MPPPDTLRWIYLGELVLLAAVGAAAVPLGARIARASSRVGHAAVIGATLLMALGPLGLLWPAIATGTPQPFGCAVDVLRAGALVLVGAAFVLLEGRETRRTLIGGLALAALLFVYRGPLALVVTGPSFAALDGQVVDGHMQQSTAATCFPSCLAMAMADAGVTVDEGTMAARCRTTPFGTDTFRAVYAIRATAAASGVPLNIRYRTGLDWPDLPRLSGAAILSVYIGPIGHAILVRPAGAGHVLLSDPLKEEAERVTLENLASRYTWQGDALMVERAR